MIRTQRLLATDGATETWDVTLYGYDALGRQIKTVAHASDPTYVDTYPDLAGYVPLSDPDLDFVTETFYKVGRAGSIHQR